MSVSKFCDSERDATLPSDALLQSVVLNVSKNSLKKTEAGLKGCMSAN